VMKIRKKNKWLYFFVGSLASWFFVSCTRAHNRSYVHSFFIVDVVAFFSRAFACIDNRLRWNDFE
jgi:hypothetical protein